METETTNISEIKKLVKEHLAENRARREAYLQLLKELDKDLDELNSKIDRISKAEAAESIEEDENSLTIDSENNHFTFSFEEEFIDLSFLPLTNVDDMDDLEEKLSSDLSFKQNMVSIVFSNVIP